MQRAWRIVSSEKIKKEIPLFKTFSELLAKFKTLLFIILSRHRNIMPLHCKDNLDFESVCDLHRGGLEPSIETF